MVKTKVEGKLEFGFLIFTRYTSALKKRSLNIFFNLLFCVLAGNSCLSKGKKDVNKDKFTSQRMLFRQVSLTHVTWHTRAADLRRSQAVFNRNLREGQYDVT